MRGYLPVIAVFAIVVVAIAGLLWLAGAPLRNDLALCDEAVRATLKAPSTYRRIGSPDYRSTLYSIEYDAENSFGVPLRREGWCSIKDGGERAEWWQPPGR